MNRFAHVLVAVLLLVLSTDGGAQVTQVQLKDGDAVSRLYNFPPSAEASPATADFLPDGAEDFLYSHWWHFRREGDTRESALHNLSVTDFDPNDSVVSLWFDEGNFIWQVGLTLTDGPAPNWATLDELHRIDSSVPLSSIDYIDIDINPSLTNQARRIPVTWSSEATNGIQVANAGGTMVVNFRYPFIDSAIGDYVVANYPAIRGLLTDSVPMSFDNSGLPYGGDTGGDFTAATSLKLGSGTFLFRRCIEIRPVETITWDGGSGSGSFSDPNNWSGMTGDGSTAPQNWRIADINGGEAVVNQDVVVRELTIYGDYSVQGGVVLDSPHLLGVVTDTTLWGYGSLAVSDGVFHTHSLTAGLPGFFVHTDGDVVIDGGTFDVPANYHDSGSNIDFYDIHGASAADSPVVSLINGATWTPQPEIDYVRVGFTSQFPGRLEVRSGTISLEGDARLWVFGGEVLVTSPGSAIETESGNVISWGMTRILDGGRVEGSDVEIGASPMEVSGTNGLPSILRARGNLSVYEGGELTITQGGLVDVVAQDADLSYADVTVRDAGSLLSIGGSLDVGYYATLNVTAGGLVTVGSTLTVDSLGNVELDGGQVSVYTGGVELFGTLSGRGEVLIAPGNSFVNDGLVSPGGPLGPDGEEMTGLLTITGGRYVQQSGGALHIDLGGTDPEEYDRLVVNGDARLGGTLEVSLVDPVGGTNIFVPSAGDSFEILAASDLSGTFATESFPAIPGKPGLEWRIDYDTVADTVSLTVSPIFEADFDEDGDVDNADLAIWDIGYGNGTLHTEGDADGDHDVDGSDFLVWQQQFGLHGDSSSSGLIVAADVVVPEPASAWMAALAMVLVAIMRQGCRGAKC